VGLLPLTPLLHDTALMELNEAVTAYLQRAGTTQVELAVRAQVSQSTVSRAKMRAPLRRSAAQARLFSFIQKEMEGDVHPRLKEALSRTWDGSDDHATALAALISVSGELWPKLAGRSTNDLE
jgi:hypothetical protein